MIHIDFQAGAHGNFLEFVCNLIAGVDVLSDNPFNSKGAAHIKQYLLPKVFYAGHYLFNPTGRRSFVYNKVIAVKISEDDLLPLSQISLLRAGDYGYDNNELEINTFNKLNNYNYRPVLDSLRDSYFTNQIRDSYNAVKDISWPDVQNLNDFQNLPEHIRRECINVHKLELLEISAERPDCPRHVLREFFQIGFEQPLTQGFMLRQKCMQYDETIRVYDFPFNLFYDTEKFLAQLKLIASWAGISYTKETQIVELHKMFLKRQPYKDSKSKCDQIVQQLINNEIQPPQLNLIEESYVNAMLRKHGHECRY